MKASKGNAQWHWVAVVVAAVGLHDVEQAVLVVAVQVALAAGEEAKCCCALRPSSSGGRVRTALGRLLSSSASRIFS